MPTPSERGLDLRARTLIAADDRRIRRALRRIPSAERRRSPDAAYFQAARLVAEHDASTEQARRRHRQVLARPAARAAYIGAWAVAAAVAGGLGWALVRALTGTA
jgi:hypothetical protein